MNNLLKERLINEIFCSDCRWTVTDGYMKKAQKVADPVIEEYKSEIKSSVIQAINNTLHISETWSEAVKKRVSFEETKAYVDGYNDAVTQIERQTNAYITYLEDIITKAIDGV